MSRVRGKSKSSSRAASAIGVSLILAACVLLVVFISNAYASGGPNPPHPPTAKVKGWCGNSGQSGCPVDPGWVSVGSESLSDVVAAITSVREFGMMKSQFDYVSLDTPVLVHHYGPHTGIDYFDDDHWVVSVRNTTGTRCGIFDFVYDRNLHRMRFASFAQLMPGDTRGSEAFPYLSLQTALNIVQTQYHVGMEQNTQAELIFFPINPEWRDLHSPVHTWSGGGQSPMEPMWYMIGSDGNKYFVGKDLNAHTSSELPIAQV